jgi:large subunit ribosomal protein L3
VKALVATKIGMTQSFGPDGQLVPVTLLQAMPCVVTQLRSQDKDGYRAVQVGYGESTKLGKAQAGHLKAAGSKSRKLKEFRLEGETDLAVGASG